MPDLTGPDTRASASIDQSPNAYEKAAEAYREAAEAIRRRAPNARASADADEPPIVGPIPLPRRRPIMADDLYRYLEVKCLWLQHPSEKLSWASPTDNTTGKCRRGSPWRHFPNRRAEWIVRDSRKRLKGAWLIGVLDLWIVTQCSIVCIDGFEVRQIVSAPVPRM
jgi:hypothetical protein